MHNFLFFKGLKYQTSEELYLELSDFDSSYDEFTDIITNHDFIFEFKEFLERLLLLDPYNTLKIR